jgi:hypothetical protein
LDKPAATVKNLGGFVGNAAALFEIFAAQLGYVAAGFSQRVAAFGRLAHDAAAGNFASGGREQERNGSADGYAGG